MDLYRRINQKYRTHRQRRSWQHTVQFLAAVIVFCTTYALVLPALTMTAETVCGLDAHIHSNACRETIPSTQCTLPESEGHAHQDACYTQVLSLTCPVPETLPHSHLESCLGTVSTLICTDQDEAHSHVATCYFYETGFVCGMEETEGHSHGESCYTPASQLICGKEASEGHFHDESCAPVAGELICSLQEHSHDESCLSTEETQPSEDTQPSEETHAAEETILPETESVEGSETEPDWQPDFSAVPSTEDWSEELPAVSQAQVALPTDTTVPSDAALTVTAVTQDDAQYAAMAEQLHQMLTGNVTQMTLMDISFYDASGDYLPVSDTAQVQVCFADDIFSNSEVKVFHFVDGTPVELENVSVSYTAAVTEEETEAIQTQLNFETEGFSVFAVVTVTDTTNRITVVDPAELAGNSYYIVSNNQSYIMIDSIHTNGNGLAWASYTGTDSLSEQTTWTFVDALDGTYYVLSNNGKYMVMEDSSGDTAKVSLTTTKDEATKFTVRAINGQVEIGYDGPNGIAHYLNVYQGNQDFLGWRDSGTTDQGSKVYLHLAEDASGSYNLVTDLNGKSFAIVSNAQSKALTTVTATVNGVPGLQSQNVSFITANDARYAIGDVPLWTFEATDAEGVYHISTMVDGSKKYLRLLDTYYNSNNDGRGSLMLGDEAQDITVTANDDGTVYLTFTDTNGKTGYINQDQSGDYNFWTYNAENNANKLLLCEVTDSGLLYNLNAPSGQSWFNTPSLSSVNQQIPEDSTTLFTVQGSNSSGTFAAQSTPRSDVISFYNTYNSQNPDSYLSPGREYRFLGWQATVDGTDYLFAENASVTLDSDGNIHIQDTDGVERILPAGTTLTGQWQKVSEIALFFVNFGDTMLATEDNQPISGFDSSYYTGIVAIGHIYNASTISSDSNTISRSNDALIQAQITAQYDPSDSSSQIVIDAVSQINSAGTFEYVSVSNYNQSLLETAVAAYLRKDSTSNTQVKIDGAHVERSEITDENYKLYWYLQKIVDTDGDSWHIDGVLVAKTQPLEIYKTFSGLTDAETTTAINSMKFPLYLIHQATTDTAEKEDYLTLSASSSQKGVYTNDGQQGSSHIYKWTLQSIQGQRYAFEETGYTVAGHDWSGLISVHYTDGSIKYRYNTYTTFDKYDLFADTPLVGGEVESVIFANFYTETGTGMFSVSKVQAGNEQNRLSGAEFTLTGSNGSKTVTTNENGAAHFSDLAPGTYTLAETKAPTGYQKVETTWTVTVAKDSSNNVTVKINDGARDTLLYDSANGGITQVYLIENTPEVKTVIVNKYFTTITESEVKDLTNYSIKVESADGTIVKTLTLNNATPITGSQNGYTWTIELTCGEKYTFTEENYSHSNYLDTVVTATVNGSEVTIAKSNDNSTASFSVTKSESADTVNITNDYTNTFLLRIYKVDATNSNAAMAGLTFNIYGDWEFHKTPPDGVSATILYTNTDGTTKTAYYIGTTNPTDDNGITEFANMHLSSGSRSFLYVIDEAVTPAGYVKLDEPIVQIVEVTNESYANGVCSLTVENHQEVKATVTVTADNVWSVPDGTTPPPVSLTLYKQAADGTVTAVTTVTLDGTTSETTTDGVTTKIDGWQAVWSGLAYADSNTRNEYYVSAAVLPGYITTYSTTVSTLTVADAQTAAAIAEGVNLKRSVTLTHTTGYELPNTGGSGTRWFAPLGLLLMLTGVAAAGICRRRSRRR